MSRKLIALVLCMMVCTLTIGAASAQDGAFSRSMDRPQDIRIVSAPEDTTGRNLVIATWIMVVANAILCAVGWIGARNQSKDNQASIAVGRQSAEAAGRSADAAVRSSEAANASAQLAARQQRDMLERETNIVAHRVATLAARVLELVPLRVTLSHQIFRDFDASPEKHKLDEMSERTQEALASAEAVLAATPRSKSDESLAGDLRQLDRHQVVLEAFKEQVSDEITDLRRTLRENQEAARRFQDRAEQQMRELRNR